MGQDTKQQTNTFIVSSAGNGGIPWVKEVSRARDGATLSFLVRMGEQHPLAFPVPHFPRAVPLLSPSLPPLLPLSLPYLRAEGLTRGAAVLLSWVL